MFNVIKFFIDNKLNFAKSGSKHTRPGWVNVHCPFCGGNDYHLGIHIATGAVNCWKCGPHSQISLVKLLIDCTWAEAEEIQKEYATRGTGYSNIQEDMPKRRLKTVCEYPSGTYTMKTAHREYLNGRNFDDEYLEKYWGLRGTSNLGDYKFRIIAPIYFDGRFVSFQGRDYTGKSRLRYKACEQINEVIHHQNLVYGIDKVKGKRCIVVEGITDVWRLGDGAVCCFGTAFTFSQINLLRTRFKEVFILFDSDDSNAIKMANKLGVMLSASGLSVEILELEEGDPAQMPQDEADNLMNELNL